MGGASGEFNIEMMMPLEEGINSYEIQQQVMQQLSTSGFGVPQQPMQPTASGMQKYEGQIPQDLTRLSDTQLGTLMTSLTDWCGFVNYRLAEADMNRTVALNQLEHAEARIRLTPQVRLDENGKKRGVQERDDMVTTDRRYVQAKSRYLYYNSFHTLLKAIANAADQNFQAVSRRITQRGQEIERERRNQNVPSMGKPMFKR